MATFIRSSGADLVALQEVPLASVDGVVIDQPALFGELAGLDFRYGTVWSYPLIEPDTGRVIGVTMWGNAVLSRHPIATTATYQLPTGPDDDPVDPVDTESRSALSCVVSFPEGGKVTFVSTHLAYLGGRQRRLQATGLAVIVGATNGPLLIAGDLNAPIESPELAALRDAGMDDPFDALGFPAGNNRRESCGRDRIDHVLTRGFTALECRVAREAGDASDHWPVVARLRLNVGSGLS